MKMGRYKQEKLYHKVFGFHVGQRVSWKPQWAGDKRKRYYGCWVVEPEKDKKVRVHFGNPTRTIWVDVGTLRVITPYKKREKK